MSTTTDRSSVSSATVRHRSRCPCCGLLSHTVASTASTRADRRSSKPAVERDALPVLMGNLRVVEDMCGSLAAAAIGC